jgi:hypothetical protein
MINRMDKKVKPGSKWYILSMKWVNKWQNYIYFDHLSNSSEPLKIDKSERKNPGILDNSDILEILDPKTYHIE